jgi:AraC-like DNA-binding protein
MRGALCMGDVTMTALAAQLGMHAKTLERHLAKEQTNFETLRGEVRYVVARDLLDVTDLPVGEIALALSYATPSAFNHAFRRWSGTTPSDWRAANISKAR